MVSKVLVSAAVFVVALISESMFVLLYLCFLVQHFRCYFSAINILRVCKIKICFFISGAGIIGGREAAPHSRPYMASIQVPEGENLKHECGGFVVADQWVMTAVHCLPNG